MLVPPLTADLWPGDAPAAAILHGSASFGRAQTIRFEIRRWWVEHPVRWAAWLMLNPSRAGAVETDPTAQRVTHFTRSWGFDGWIGVNLYPFISSTPADMWRWAEWESNGPDWYARDDLQHNLCLIEEVGRLASLRVVAFGAQPADRDQMWLEECLQQFQQPSSCEADERLYCLGTNKTGQPLHPMARGKWRVPDSCRPVLWRAT